MGNSPFNFDEWMELYKRDPALFEKKRREETGKAISAAPPHLQQKLRRLQWKIDMERGRASNPLSACIRLNKMMMDEMYKDGGLRDSLVLLRESILRFMGKPINKVSVHGKTSMPREAKILPFRPTLEK